MYQSEIDQYYLDSKNALMGYRVRQCIKKGIALPNTFMLMSLCATIGLYLPHASLVTAA